jgi:hypothetical protein
MSSKNSRLDLLLLTLGVALLLGLHLGRRSLWEPDEGRYAEIPREMLATGDFVTPRLNGVKYFEKPPLFYWIEAAAMRALGPAEWALRLPPALFALGGCLAVYAAGRRLFGRRAGLLAAVILATSPLYFGIGQVVILDMAVSVLLTAALLAFLLATREPPGWRRRLCLWTFWGAAALAVLTKGLIGIVLPALIIGAWTVLFRRWSALRLTLQPSGIALFLLIAVPWHVLVARANPEFAWFYFIHEHFLRYTTRVHKRYEPFWFFLPVLLVGMLPWILFLPRAVRGALAAVDDERRVAGFLLLWAGLVFVFFSLSDSKLVPYILPVVPPLALLVGRSLASVPAARAAAEHRFSFFWKRAVPLALCAAVALPLLAPGIVRAPKAERYLALLGDARFALAGSLLLLGVVPLLWVRTGRGHWLPAALVAASALFLITLGACLPRFDREMSIRELALDLRSRLRPGDVVVTYHQYYQGLPFYLDRKITVAALLRSELDFGMRAENVSAWMIGEADFQRLWNSGQTVYLVGDERFESPVASGAVSLVARSGRNLLLVNRPLRSSP